VKGEKWKVREERDKVRGRMVKNGWICVQVQPFFCNDYGELIGNYSQILLVIVKIMDLG